MTAPTPVPWPFCLTAVTDSTTPQLAQAAAAGAATATVFAAATAVSEAAGAGSTERVINAPASPAVTRHSNPPPIHTARGTEVVEGALVFTF